MFAVSCDGSLGARLFSIDSASGDSNQISDNNDQVVPNGCAYQTVWDATTGTAYAQDAGNNQAFYKVDLTTGKSTLAFQPNLGGTQEVVDGLAIDASGNAYAVNAAGDTLYKISLTNGDLSDAKPLGVTEGTEFSLAADPTNSENLYGFAASTGILYKIDPDSGAASVLADDLPLSTGYTPASLQVDSAGNIWVDDANVSTSAETDLWSLNPNASDIAASAQLSGALNASGTNYFSYTILDIPTAGTKIVSSTATATAGTPLSFQIATTGWPAPTFAITDGTLPAGLTLDPTTGVISGTTSQVGTFTLSIDAGNITGGDEAKFTLTVAPVLATTGVDAGPEGALGLGLLVAGVVGAGVGILVRRRRMGINH